MRVRVCGVPLKLKLVPHLWAVIRLAVHEDDGSVEIGDALAALLDLASIFRRKKARLRDDCGFTRNAHARLLQRLAAETKDVRRHVGDDGEFDGEESDDVSASADWLSQWTGPGALLSVKDAAELHNFMTRHLTSDGYDAEDPGSSFVLCDGPVHDAVQKSRSASSLARSRIRQ